MLCTLSPSCTVYWNGVRAGAGAGGGGLGGGGGGGVGSAVLGGKTGTLGAGGGVEESPCARAGLLQAPGLLVGESTLNTSSCPPHELVTTSSGFSNGRGGS